MSAASTNETAVQVSAVLVAFAAVLAFETFGGVLNLGDAGVAAGSVVFNVVVFGGAHLYLAARGEDGSVPVASRWRFLAFLGVVAAAALVAIAFPSVVESATGLDVRAVGVAFLVVVGAAYLVLEARSGYRDAMAGDDAG